MTLLGSLRDSGRVDQLHASLLLKAAGLEDPHNVHHHGSHYISFSRFIFFFPGWCHFFDSQGCLGYPTYVLNCYRSLYQPAEVDRVSCITSVNNVHTTLIY